MNTILQGIQVVNLAVNVPGPIAARRLADLGAAVVKVEPPDGDPLALVGPDWYDQLCAGQKILRLNLKDTTDRQRLDELLFEADLLLTASRPAGLTRLGLGWDALHIRFPRLCQVAIVGAPGPLADLPGHDLTYQAAARLVRPPDMPLTLLADLAGAQEAVTSALALLLQRQSLGQGGYIEVSLQGSVELFTAPRRHGLTRPGGLLGGGLPQYGLYPARDGWVALAALELHFWQRLCIGLGLDPAAARRADLEGIFRQKTAAEWEHWALDHDLPLVQVQ
jgi:crotonobetainyl-CoA:carnitine CoA-transferase CaiB-like acyl-CoA transferase